MKGFPEHQVKSSPNKITTDDNSRLKKAAKSIWDFGKKSRSWVNKKTGVTKVKEEVKKVTEVMKKTLKAITQHGQPEKDVDKPKQIFYKHPKSAAEKERINKINKEIHKTRAKTKKQKDEKN